MTKPAKRMNRQLEKTVKFANDYFRMSAQSENKARAAIQHFVARLLLDAGHYHGFRYLAADELQQGYKCGIMSYIENGETKHNYPDPSRVQFL